MVKSAFQTLGKYRHLIKGAVLEVGSDRFEGSTAHFASICKELGVPFYSVDCEPGAHERAKSVPGTNAFLATGEAFLETEWPKINQSTGSRFSFVFLDNFDFLIKSFKWEWEGQTRQTYQNLGLELNNENSQKAHLAQAQLVQPWLEQDAIIGFDDTWQKPDGTFDGKGGTAVPWLLEQGYFILEQGRIGEDVVGGYVMLSKMAIPLKIRVITCCKNEKAMIPFFLQYYSKFADEIIFFDGGSTDGSLEIIIQNPKARIYPTGHNVDELDDRVLMRIRNEEYKRGRELWDWQIVVDLDEFLYHPNLVQKLQEYKLRGVTIPLTAGYEMLSKDFPVFDPNRSIVDQIQTGKRNDEWQAKSVVFNPQVVDINYEMGCHRANPTGRVVSNESQELMVLHYRWLGYEYFVGKNTYAANQLSEFNKANNFGWHTSKFSKMTREEFDAEIAKAYNIFSLKITVTDGNSLPYPDASAIEIEVPLYVLERVDFHKAWGVLREWQRVLVEGGRLVIETTDLMALCKAFTQADAGKQIPLYERFYGSPWYGKGHQFMYTETQLGWTLESLKFRNIIRKPSSNELGLRMECVK